MSIDQAAFLKALFARITPVVAPEAGIVRWHVPPGTHVNEGDVLLHIFNDEGALPVKSTVTGQIMARGIVAWQDNLQVMAGAELCYIQTAGMADVVTLDEFKQALVQPQSDLDVHLAISEIAQAVPKVEGDCTVAGHTYRVTKGQATRVKQRVARLTKERRDEKRAKKKGRLTPAVNEGAFVRMALELALALPDWLLKDLIDWNLDREHAGNYGMGYSRQRVYEVKVHTASRISHPVSRKSAKAKVTA